MGLLDEDRHLPSWIRDYGALDVDAAALTEFAAALAAETADHYAGHVERVRADLQPPDIDAGQFGPADFVELAGFVETHRTAARDTTHLLHFHGNAAGALADAVAIASGRYRSTDALAAARLDNRLDRPDRPDA
ncbi:hypothetical protein ACN27F_12710 [Solwaraspora sp. WMMB335]|uniref:hypothetical protein n=1 Tax=Solwaraspora sp. WMMB335 TaxID=3404118 RepID=UPI003B958880